MSEQEMPFGIRLPDGFSTSPESLSKLKAKQSHSPESATTPSKSNPEAWFGRGALFGTVMMLAMFLIGDYSGHHRREAFKFGVEDLLTEWTEAQPNITAAEVLAAVKCGHNSPQKSDSTTPQSSQGPSASPPARSTVDPSK